MGRKKTVDFESPDFDTLSKDERRIRGRMSTLTRMIEERRRKLTDLMKPVHSLKNEIKKCEVELDELKSDTVRSVVTPKFRVEGFELKGHFYVRGVWYVNSKKYQLYLGSESEVDKVMRGKYPKYDSLKYDEKNKLRFEYFLPELKLSYWKKNYQTEKKTRK